MSIVFVSQFLCSALFFLLYFCSSVVRVLIVTTKRYAVHFTSITFSRWIKNLSFKQVCTHLCKMYLYINAIVLLFDMFLLLKCRWTFSMTIMFHSDRIKKKKQKTSTALYFFLSFVLCLIFQIFFLHKFVVGRCLWLHSE